MTKNIREIEHSGARAETGAVQIGDDWPGLFVRGDDCMSLRFILDDYLKTTNDGPFNSCSLLANSLLEQIKSNVLGQ